MNRKQTKLISITLAILGSYLFYKQEAGVNRLIFTIISAVVLILLNNNKGFKRLAFAILPSLLTSVFILWYPQLLTRIIWLLSYLIMWSSMLTSPYPIVTILQGSTSIFDSQRYLFKKDNFSITSEDPVKGNKWLIYIISSIIILIFTMLYINSNPVFAKLFLSIDLSFIEFGFLLMVTILFLLLFGLINITPNKDIQQLNLLDVFISQTELSKRDEQEFTIAKLSIWIISAILMAANIGDLIVIFTGALPEGVTYTEYVHQGFNTLILSLSLAIGLVIYFFRGQLNFHTKLKLIKNASTFWIIQNLLLALITAHKNFRYVEAYGFTYKRIAVFLWLICVIIGLLLSLKKIQKPYTNWLYFNKITLSAYVCFVLMSFIPVDRLITQYNLSYARNIDIEYLLDLSKPDLLLLNEYLNKSEGVYSNHTMQANKKIKKLTEKVNNSNWQSWSFYLNDYKME